MTSSYYEYKNTSSVYLGDNWKIWIDELYSINKPNGMGVAIKYK